jgi:hypothetical protein
VHLLAAIRLWSFIKVRDINPQTGNQTIDVQMASSGMLRRVALVRTDFQRSSIAGYS